MCGIGLDRADTLSPMASLHPIGRSAALASTACLGGAAALAVFDGARLARERIAGHGYDRMEFAVGAREVWRAALDEQWLSSTLVAAACVASVTCAAWILRATAPGSPSRAGWSAFLAALGALAYLAGVQASKSWLGVRDWGFALVAVAGVALLTRPTRAGGDGAHRTAPALREHTLALAFASMLPALMWAARDLPWRPASPSSWLRVGAGGLAFVLGWRALAAAAESRPLRRIVWAVSAALIVAPLAFRATLERSIEGHVQRARPLNVLLIGLDTVRADATSLSSAGPVGRDTTPRLREFAERGLVFERAVSQAPWTLPAFASILTGRYPLEHGAHRITSRLARGETTLAEILREAGYFTAAITSHVYLDRRHGLDQGFEHFDFSNALGHKAVTSSSVTDLAIDALATRDERPFFLFAHYFDPHYEYIDHRERAWADGYQGWLREQNDFENLLKIRHLVEAPEVEWLSALYHEEIAHTDAQVGRLLDWLREAGLEDDTLVVVVADHGEEFAERGNFGHTISLYEEQLAVPLMILAPGERAGRVRSVVETRAIFDTVLDRLGVDFERSRRATSLLETAERELANQTPLPDSRAFASVWLDDSKLSWGKRIRAASLREGRWKLVDDVTRGRRMLFDLDTDPHERRNVLADQPQVAERLNALLEPWIKQQSNLSRPSPRASVDAPTEQALKALGYM